MAESPRSIVKKVAETVLVRSGAAAIARRRRIHDVAILAYHNIVPRGESVFGERSLHLDQDAFGVQLDHLMETHEIVGLDDLIERGPGAGAPAAVVTFDDAYLGALTAPHYQKLDGVTPACSPGLDIQGRDLATQGIAGVNGVFAVEAQAVGKPGHDLFCQGGQPAIGKPGDGIGFVYQ